MHNYDLEYILSADTILDTSILHTPAAIAAHESALRTKHQLRNQYEKHLKAEAAQEELKRHQPPSEDELYARAVAVEAAKKADAAKRKEREDFWQKKHMEYLASTPDVAEISANNTFEFIRELELWISKGYKTVENTVTLSFPLFTAQLKKVTPNA